MQDTKILRHHSLAKFLEQVEQYINEGYSILLNDIKTYPKQVAGMFFATMVKNIYDVSEYITGEASVVAGLSDGEKQELSELVPAPLDIVKSDSQPEDEVDGMPETTDVAVDDPIVAEPEKVVSKRRTKTQAGQE